MQAKAPLGRVQVQTPMDLGSILCRVDKRQYPTVGHFMADVALIGRGMQQYWGDDPQGVQVIPSRTT